MFFCPRRLFAYLSLFLASNISFAAPPALEIGAPVVRRDLPQGSGLARCAEAYYGISDLNGLLYVLDRDFRVARTHPLRVERQPGSWLGRKIDPDFESIACFTSGTEDWLIVLGSGHRTGVSDSGHLVLAADPTRKYHRSMAPLYAQLAASVQSSAMPQLNIEGLAIAGDTVFLFQRGTHFFRLALPELLAYLRGESETPPAFTTFSVLLPPISGSASAFSGAEYWPEAQALIFTASVEAKAPDAPKGKRLASALGLIDLDALRTDAPLDLRPRTTVMRADERTLHTKAESLIITQSNACQIHGTLVSDNDDGKSVFRAFTLTQDAPATGRVTCPESRENERQPRP